MLDFLRVSKTSSRMDSVLEKYGVTWVIYEANSPLCRLLEAGKGWKRIYADGFAKILVKDIPENRALIEKYPNVISPPAGMIVWDDVEDRLDR